MTVARMLRAPAFAVALAFAVVSPLAACGGDDTAPVPLALVDPSLAPAQAAPRVKLFENTDDSTAAAFADAGDTSLMADGRLWELRRAERLVGTLQITTLLPDVDLLEERRRDGIVRGIMAGAVNRIRIDDVEVHTLELQDRAQYVWFGTDVVQVLTVRAEEDVVPEDILRSILDHQRTQSAWNPLPVTVDDRLTTS